MTIDRKIERKKREAALKEKGWAGQREAALKESVWIGYGRLNGRKRGQLAIGGCTEGREVSWPGEAALKEEEWGGVS